MEVEAKVEGRVTKMFQAESTSNLERLPRDDVLFKLLLPKLDIKDW